MNSRHWLLKGQVLAALCWEPWNTAFSLWRSRWKQGQGNHLVTVNLWLFKICWSWTWDTVFDKSIKTKTHFVSFFSTYSKTAWKNQNKTQWASLLQNFGQIVGKEAKAPSFYKLLHMIASNESSDMKYCVEVSYQHFDSNSNWTVDCFFMILHCFKIEYFKCAIMRSGEFKNIGFMRKCIKFLSRYFTAKIVYTYPWNHGRFFFICFLACSVEKMTSHLVLPIRYWDQSSYP